MFRFSKSTSLLGIDIGTSYIKAVQLKPVIDKFQLESYGVVNVVYPTESQIKFDAITQTAEILKALHERAGFTTKKVAVSVPSNVAFVSILNFPPMAEKEMQKSVEYQARKYIPLPINDVNLGWQILEEVAPPKVPNQKDGAPKIKVLLTAVPKNVINNYMRVMELADYEVAALEIESLSLIRSLTNGTDKENIIVIDIGAKATILSFINQGSLQATRHLTIGGDTITSSIANSMGISLERAEQMKRSSFGPSSVTPAVQIVKNIIELIKVEISQFIKMTENQNKGSTKLVLTGGGSKLPGLADEFSSLTLAVKEGNPLEGLIFEPQLENKLSALSAQLAVAIGLAMRADIR